MYPPGVLRERGMGKAHGLDTPAPSDHWESDPHQITEGKTGETEGERDDGSVAWNGITDGSAGPKGSLEGSKSL